MEIDVNKLMDDKKFVKYVINKTISCKKMLSMLDLDIDYGVNFYCVFHENNDTPAARMYKEDDGSDSIFCYSEHRLYKSSDFITKGLLNYRLESVFYRTWVQLPNEVKEYLMSNYKGDISYIPPGFEERKPKMEEYKLHKINISELNQLILDSLK